MGKRLATLAAAAGTLAASMVLAGGLAAPGVAVADQTDPRLDRLFAVLQTTDDDDQVRAAEQLIWSIWFQHTNTTIAADLQRGDAAMGSGRFGLALEIFDGVVEEAPNFAEGWNRRATLHFLMRNLEESVADVEVTLQLEPRHFGALSGLGQIELLRGDAPAALAAFEAALEVHPHLPGAKDIAGALEEKLFGKDL